jgi:O-antigen ligase
MVEGAIAWSLKTVTFLALCLCALASTVSLSAVFSMGFSGLSLLFLAKRKLTGLLALVSVLLIAAGLYFAFPEAGVLRYLTERAGNLSTFRETSTYMHYVGVIDGLKEVSRFTPEEFLTGTLGSRTELVAPETYYLRTIYLRGLPGLLVLLSIIVVSVSEAYRRYRGARGSPEQKGLFLAILVCLCSFSFASLFIPYFDTFPSNFYFWFLVAILWSEPDATPLPKASGVPQGQGSKARFDLLELKKPSSLSSSVSL